MDLIFLIASVALAEFDQSEWLVKFVDDFMVVNILKIQSIRTLWCYGSESWDLRVEIMIFILKDYILPFCEYLIILPDNKYA